MCSFGREALDLVYKENLGDKSGVDSRRGVDYAECKLKLSLRARGESLDLGYEESLDDKKGVDFLD